jgi:C4-dicarboxylate transporter DctM subunit
MVMFIIANAAVLAWVMITFRIPQSIVAPIESLTTSPVAVTLLVCLVLVALAIFLEPPAILIAVVPIVLPVVAAVGVDPLRFGVIVMLTTTIGMLLPPVGISLLVAVGILDTPLERAAKAAVPYVALAAVTLVLVVLFPDTTRLLVKLVH